MRHYLLTFLIISTILVTGCAAHQDKRLLLSFSGQEAYTPESPQIFIPGLGFTGKFWSESKMFSLFKDYGWYYGGDLKITTQNGVIQLPLKNTLIPAHFYSITFSDTQLAIQQQGKELAKAIEYIKQLNEEDKVVLFGHSMGGLAAREYLQSDYYRNDVAANVSIGTPHQGSDFDLDRPLMKLVPESIQNLFWEVDRTGDAVRDLRTNSLYLNGGNEATTSDRFKSKDINLNGNTTDMIIGLNEFELKPLPEDVFYVSVIGGGNPAIATKQQSKASDGIVDIPSQDMNQLAGINVPAYTILSSSDHFGEADDVWIIMQIVRLREFLVKFSQFNILRYKSGKDVVAAEDLKP